MSRSIKPKVYKRGDVLYNPASDSLLLVEHSYGSIMRFHFTEQLTWRFMTEVPDYLVYIGTL